MDKTPKELEGLIWDGMSQLLYSCKHDFTNRNYNEWPLNHKEQLYLIKILHDELECPELPSGLIYIYGHILQYIKENILYN